MDRRGVERDAGRVQRHGLTKRWKINLVVNVEASRRARVDLHYAQHLAGKYVSQLVSAQRAGGFSQRHEAGQAKRMLTRCGNGTFFTCRLQANRTVSHFFSMFRVDVIKKKEVFATM